MCPPTLLGVGRGLAGGCGGSTAQTRRRQLLHHQHNSWSFSVSQGGWGRGGGSHQPPDRQGAPSSSQTDKGLPPALLPGQNWAGDGWQLLSGMWE